MKETLAETVKQNIEEHALLANGDFVLVAVSGGADSVCLLDLMVSYQTVWQLKLAVAHVNHMLRGDEADRDEAFVRSLCNTYGIPFYSVKSDVARFAKQNKLSLEEAGRAVRYAFFQELKEKYGMTKIATAHNKNDNAETVCMRFMRGSSIKGLCGIPVCTESGIIRPLLFTSREEIEAYLTEKNLSFVTDSSNGENEYTRNKIRNTLIPHITAVYNPNFTNTLSKNIEEYCEAEMFLKKHCDLAYERLVHLEYYGASIKKDSLLAEDSVIAKRVLKKVIFDLIHSDMPSQTIRQLYTLAKTHTSATFCISKNLTLHLAYDTLFFVEETKAKNTRPIVSIKANCFEKIQFGNKHTMFLRASLNPQHFSVRTRMPGDTIFLGSCGHKKVKDLLIDEKVPVFLRDDIPIVCYKNEIVWVCGLRDNPTYRANPNDTSCVKLTYQKEINHA